MSEARPLTVLSLGAGVQSSTLALMAAHGELPKPDAAIFADTKAEPRAVYQWLDWLETQLPFPVYRVQQGDGLTAWMIQAVRQGKEYHIPVYTESANGGGQLKRQCTTHYKLRPIERKVRALTGLTRKPAGKTIKVHQWIGISLDEVVRMKPSRAPWVQVQWPLIEARMTRVDCITWMERHGYPRPSRSSCTFCPYHSDSEWRWLRDSDPDGWRQAVEVDRLIRDGVRGTRERLYLHRSLRPLEEVDLSTPQERGQLELFAEECSGYCFV